MKEAPPAYTWVVLVVLTMLSGMFSGLNLGLMSLTVEDLDIVIKSSDDQAEVFNAELILPLRRHGNLLLCTLLIGNTLVNVMLAVVTDPIWVYFFGTGTAGTILALALPSLLIVVCGEIVPQSICSRYALFIGAKTLPLTYIFVFVTFPLAYPISKLLDRLLGDEIGGVFNRRGLVQLVKLNLDSPQHARKSNLRREEGKILVGALTLPDRTLGQVMTTLHKVFSLHQDATLDKETLLTIVQRGHTRIPVHDGDTRNIVGILHTQCLLGIGFERELPIKEVMMKLYQNEPGAFQVRRIPKATDCNVALEVFKREGVQILIVTEQAFPNTTDRVAPLGTGPALGIVTAEDIIEEILQDELVDEMDYYASNGAPSVGVSRSGSCASLKSCGSRTMTGLTSKGSTTSLGAGLTRKGSTTSSGIGGFFGSFRKGSATSFSTMGSRAIGRPAFTRRGSKVQVLNQKHVDAAVLLRGLSNLSPRRLPLKIDGPSSTYGGSEPHNMLDVVCSRPSPNQHLQPPVPPGGVLAPPGCVPDSSSSDSVMMRNWTVN